MFIYLFELGGGKCMNKLLKSLLAAVVISAISVKTVNVYAEESEDSRRQEPTYSSEVQAEIDALLEQINEISKIAHENCGSYHATEESLQQALEQLTAAETALKEARAANDLSHVSEMKAMVESELRKNKEALEKAIAENADKSIIQERQAAVEQLTAELERYNTERTEAELATAEENYVTAKSKYDSALSSYEELKQKVDYYDQIECDLALQILALQGIDGRTGTMSEEIYEKFYGKKNETTTEAVAPTEPEVESVVEETHEEKIEEEVFPVHFAESTAEHSLEMAEIQESTNHPVTPIDFSALSFAVLAGVGIYMARKKH